MQVASWNMLGLVGWLLILAGVILIVIGFAMRVPSWNSDKEVRTESKGVILLGPIPIVWGFGRIGWIIAAVVAVSLFVLLFALTG